MAKQATVAPKERVNIVYKPSLDDAQEDVELPLKMLVLGDFTGNPAGHTPDRRDDGYRTEYHRTPGGRRYNPGPQDQRHQDQS